MERRVGETTESGAAAPARPDVIGRARPWILALAGPLLIVAGVLVVLHAIAFGGRVSQQHPDILAEWLPSFCFLGKSIAAAHVPAWDPHVMGGVPFAADPQSGWGYLPAMALFAAMPCARAIRWFIVLQPILAGLGVLWFLRSEGLSRTASTVGGLTLALGVAGSKSAVELPFAGTLAWTALTLAAASRLLHVRGWPAKLGWAAATAIAWGQIADAHPSHGLVIGSAALLAYLVTRVVADRRARPRRELLTASALLLVSLPLVNMAILLPRLTYVPHTTLGWGYAKLQEASYRLGAMPTPHLAVGPALPPSWPLGFSYSPGLYLGGAALLCSLAGWRARPTRPLFVGFGAYGLVFYVLSLRPVARWLAPHVASSSIGGFYVHAPVRLLYAVLLATAIATGLGVEAWRGARTWSERATLAVPGVLVWLVLPIVLGLTWTPLRLLTWGMVAAAAVLVLAARRPALLSLLPVVVAGELIANGLLGQQPSYPAPETLPKPFVPRLEAPSVPIAPYVREDAIARAISTGGPGRYVSLLPPIVGGGKPPGRGHAKPHPRGGFLGFQEGRYWPFQANQRAILLGLEDTGGYNPVQLRRYWTFVRTVDRRPLRYNVAFFVHPGPAVLDLLQVRWVVQARGTAPWPGGRVVARDGSAVLYAIPDPAPRASLFTSWRTVPTAGGALRAAATASGASLNDQVILEGGGPGAGGPPAPSTPAEFRWTGSGSATVTVDASSPSVLLVRNAYEPNWSAAVDGEAARVVPADGIDQGIAVPAGRHTVTLAYDDPAIGIGMLVSFLSLAVLLGTAAALWRLGRRASARDRPEPGAVASPGGE